MNKASNFILRSRTAILVDLAETSMPTTMFDAIYPPTWLISWIIGKNTAIAIPPTSTPIVMIIIGSNIENIFLIVDGTSFS
jgi:hypothetical protein